MKDLLSLLCIGIPLGLYCRVKAQGKKRGKPPRTYNESPEFPPRPPSPPLLLLSGKVLPRMYFTEKGVVLLRMKGSEGIHMGYSILPFLQHISILCLGRRGRVMGKDKSGI